MLTLSFVEEHLIKKVKEELDISVNLLVYYGMYLLLSLIKSYTQPAVEEFK